MPRFLYVASSVESSTGYVMHVRSEEEEGDVET
jgi:hypothetical protein